MINLSGAGSTFDFPFFDVAFKAYAGRHGLNINYQPVGSSAGIQSFTQKLADFGATDVPLNPVSELPAAIKAGGPVEQFPIALGGVAIAYNLSGVKTGLHLDGETLAKMYFGVIAKWNDPRIQKLNRGVNLPGTAIQVVHRSDGSGTSYAFTDYLSKVSDQWRGQVGVSKTPNWPTGIGGKGNLGVAELVQHTEGAIAYVELAYALQNHVKEAMIENRAHRFQLPSLKTVVADAKAFGKVSAEQFSITDGKGKNAYPIATYSWLLVFREQPDTVKRRALVGLMKWLVTYAQDKYARALDYAPLPRNVQQIGLSALLLVK